MLKRDYELEEVTTMWAKLPWWVKIKIAILVTIYTWESQLAFGWLELVMW